MKFVEGQRVRCLDRVELGIDRQGAVTGRFADEGTVVDASVYGLMLPPYPVDIWDPPGSVYVRFDGMLDDEAWVCREDQIKLIEEGE